MKKYVNISFIYAIAAIACGVFYREFTKFLDFSGKTTLAFTHLHLLVLGTIMFLIIAIFSIITNLEKQNQFKRFMLLYNIGLPFMIVMFFVRGIIQAMEIEITKGFSAAISGMSGIAHIIMTIALVMLFLSLKKSEVTSTQEFLARSDIE